MATGRLWGIVLCTCSIVLMAGKAPKVPRTEPKHQCSRPISRSVRKRLEKEVLKRRPKELEDKEWPQGCPLDPRIDIWGGHEKNKSKRRPGARDWVCGYSGKVFKSEHYLDLHLERKWMNETPNCVKNVKATEPHEYCDEKQSLRTCLADYCEVFEVCKGEKGQSWEESWSVEPPPCNSSEISGARHLCDEAIHKCFPLDNPITRLLNVELRKNWCEGLSCEVRAERHMTQRRQLISTVLLVLFILFICFIAFIITVCCVDYSDDLMESLSNAKIVSSDFIKKFVKFREKSRTGVKMDRTKQI